MVGRRGNERGARCGVLSEWVDFGEWSFSTASVTSHHGYQLRGPTSVLRV